MVFRSVDSIASYFAPAEGTRSLELNAHVEEGAIAQSLITEPGRRYRVQFALAGNPNQGALKTLRVSAAGTHAEFAFDTTGHTPTDMGWETKTWEFVAQDVTTVLSFESLTAGTWAGPAVDNVVVQPFGRDDVRIYLDRNANQAFDAGEPLTFLRPDDPHTPAIDETGTYRFTGLPDGPYSVREVLGDGYLQISPERARFARCRDRRRANDFRAGFR